LLQVLLYARQKSCVARLAEGARLLLSSPFLRRSSLAVGAAREEWS
jgi:hypothetical protein